MRRLAPQLVLLLAALPLGAQETRRAIPLIPQKPVAQDPATAAPAGSYEALVQAYDAARNAWIAGYQKAAGEGDEAAQTYLRESKRPEQEFVPRFQAAAKEHAGADEAVPYLIWLARNDYQNSSGYVNTLVTAHIESPAIAPVVSMIGNGQDLASSVAVLDRIVGASPHEPVRMAAIYSRARLRMRQGEDNMTRALAKQDLQTVIEHADDRTAQRARGDLFEFEHLQIGMTAPDIAGEDLDGVAFKLSDYRGKVVVLDFWGDW